MTNMAATTQKKEKLERDMITHTGMAKGRRRPNKKNSEECGLRGDLRE